MSKIARCELILDGEKIIGFKSFKENEIEEAVVVETMDGQDVVDVPEKYGFSLKYLPDSGADREWRGVRDATLIVQRTGGKKVVYTGCRLLKWTPSELDGKTPLEYQLDFFAKGRKDS